MDIKVKNIQFPKTDHLFLEETQLNEYVEDRICNGCKSLMIPFAQIVNNSQEIGLETSLCPNCGFTKRTRNLTEHFFFKHFSSKWLIQRDEQIKKNYYIYYKLKNHLPKSGKILDLGCGLGGKLLPFKEAGYDVYGVDPSKHRSEIGMKIMPNIVTGSAEEYLSNNKIKFDAIYFHNVLQFVKDPYKLLGMAINSLAEGGKLFFKIGMYHSRSNFFQFTHFGALRSYINMYSILDKFDEWGVQPVYFQKEPFEIILSKNNNNLFWREGIDSQIKKLDMHDIELYAKKTLNYFRLKLFGKTKLRYLHRVTHLELIKPVEKILPIRFIHDTDKLPIILK